MANNTPSVPDSDPSDGSCRAPEETVSPPTAEPGAPSGGPAEAGASPRPFRSGFVAFCGRPNVGKSTLLNALVGQELAVATRLPQTTRERFFGVLSGDDHQIVLVDTPGIHRARSAFNKFMVEEALAAARDVDVVALLAEVPRLPDAEAARAWQPGPVVRTALETLAGFGHPIVLVPTKVDLMKPRALLLPVLDTWRKLHDFAAVVPVSATRGIGLADLRRELVALLPEGAPYFDPDDLSDRPLRWHAAELVRKILFEKMADEVPYSCAVVVDAYEERPRGDRIRATIHVERNSQRGIVIGKGGARIKEVRKAAQKAIERLTGRPVHLFLEVKVTRNWTKDPAAMARLGYRPTRGGPKR